MHYIYLGCKNCFAETEQNSEHCPNVVAKCLATLDHVEFSFVTKVFKGNLCTHCWRFPKTIQHDVPHLLLKKKPLHVDVLII